MSGKIIFLKGLPASGKSTWAKQYVLENLFVVRLNKDDIREEFGNPKWSKEFELKVLNTEKLRGLQALLEGNSIIIDDTNFSEKHKNYWMKISNFTKKIELENEINNLKNALNKDSI